MPHETYVTPIKDSATLSVRKGGTRFKKQIARWGKWKHPKDPNATIDLNEGMAKQMVSNFKRKVWDSVTVPTRHTTDPKLNTGEVLDLEVRSDGLYADMEIKDKDVAGKVKDGLIPNVSMHFDPDYEPTEAGAKPVGPVLQHVALVTDPYLKGLKPFEKVSLSEGVAEGDFHAIMLSESSNEEQNPMGQIKNTKEFAVKVKLTRDGEEVEETLEPGATLEVSDDQVSKVEDQITSAEKPEEDNGAEDKGKTDEAKADAGDEAKAEEAKADEAKTEEKSGDEKTDEEKKAEALPVEKPGEQSLSEREKNLAKREAEISFSELATKGLVKPTQKPSYMALAELSADISDKTVSFSEDDKDKKLSFSELFDRFIKAGSGKAVSMSEEGKTGEDADKSVDLSEEDRVGFDLLGVDPANYEKHKKEGLIE